MIFPIDCFFHYVKALWSRAKKYSLFPKTKENPENLKQRNETQTLIALLKIIPYIPDPKKEQYFKDLRESFVPKKNYNEFFNYCEKNWLKCNFTKPLELDSKQTSRLIRRTNDSCEGYHSRLVGIIPMKHPRLAILVSLLIEEEWHFRNVTIDKVSQSSDTIMNIGDKGISQKEMLPFAQIISLLRDMAKVHSDHNYELRNLKKNEKFLERLIELTVEGYKLLHGEEDDEKDEEDGDKDGKEEDCDEVEI